MTGPEESGDALLFAENFEEWFECIAASLGFLNVDVKPLIFVDLLTWTVSHLAEQQTQSPALKVEDDTRRVGYEWQGVEVHDMKDGDKQSSTHPTISSTNQHDHLTAVIQKTASILGGSAFGAEKGENCMLSSESPAEPFLLIVPGTYLSGRWIRFRATTGEGGVFGPCLLSVVPIATVGERFSGEEFENDQSYLPKEPPSSSAAFERPPALDIRLTLGADAEGMYAPALRYRFRQGDAFICKSDTCIRLEAWASKIRCLVYVVGPQDVRHSVQGHFVVEESKGRAGGEYALYYNGMPEEWAEEALEADREAEASLTAELVRVRPATSSCKFREHFQPSGPLSNTMDSFLCGASLPSRILAADKDQNPMELVMSARCSGPRAVHIECLHTTFLLRNMDLEYVFFLAKTMQRAGWRHDKPTYGVWNTNESRFIVLGGNHRAAAARVVGASEGRAMRFACVSPIETSRLSPEDDPYFLMSLAIAIQASEPSPREFTYKQQVDLLSMWLEFDGGSRIFHSAEKIYRALQDTRMFHGDESGRHFATNRNRTALRGMLYLMRSGAYSAVQQEMSLFEVEPWTKKYLFAASHCAREFDYIRGCVGWEINRRRFGTDLRSRTLEWPGKASSEEDPFLWKKDLQFPPIHFEETSCLGLHPDQMRLLEEDITCLRRSDCLMNSAALWLAITMCIDESVYATSKSRWVTNELTIAQLFFNAPQRLPVRGGNNDRQGNSRRRKFSRTSEEMKQGDQDECKESSQSLNFEYLRQHDHLLVPLCIFSHWSLVVIAKKEGSFTLFHFDSMPECNHFHRQNKVSEWARRVLSRPGAAIYENAPVKVRCTKQNDRFSCGWHVIRNAIAVVDGISGDTIENVVSRWTPGSFTKAQVEIGTIKIRCLGWLPPAESLSDPVSADRKSRKENSPCEPPEYPEKIEDSPLAPQVQPKEAEEDSSGQSEADAEQPEEESRESGGDLLQHPSSSECSAVYGSDEEPESKAEQRQNEDVREVSGAHLNDAVEVIALNDGALNESEIGSQGDAPNESRVREHVTTYRKERMRVFADDEAFKDAKITSARAVANRRGEKRKRRSGGRARSKSKDIAYKAAQHGKRRKGREIYALENRSSKAAAEVEDKSDAVDSTAVSVPQIETTSHVICEHGGSQEMEDEPGKLDEQLSSDEDELPSNTEKGDGDANVDDNMHQCDN
jgi:hypothetical protein